MIKNVDWIEWERMYQDFKNSKLSIRSWCAIKNMDVHQFYYRRKKHKEKTNPGLNSDIKGNNFIKIDHGNIKTSTLTISYNSGISLSIDGVVDIDLIESISKVLNNV